MAKIGAIFGMIIGLIYGFVFAFFIALMGVAGFGAVFIEFFGIIGRLIAGFIGGLIIILNI